MLSNTTVLQNPTFMRIIMFSFSWTWLHLPESPECLCHYVKQHTLFYCEVTFFLHWGFFLFFLFFFIFLFLPASSSQKLGNQTDVKISASFSCVENIAVKVRQETPYWDGSALTPETAGNTMRHGKRGSRQMEGDAGGITWMVVRPSETMELTKMRWSKVCRYVLLYLTPSCWLLTWIALWRRKAGSGVWNHTLVFLKYGVWQGMYTTIEEYMEKRGKVIRKIVEKCGRRYHILNNDNKS